MMTKTPKIIVWDIETSPLLLYTWGLYPDSISHDNIVEEWYIICGAWKELGKPKVSITSITSPGDDYEVVKKLREVVASADILIHHNGDKFDLKKLNARLIFHGLKPLPPIATVDTLKEVRKVAKFTSNRLDYLGKLLLGKGKIHVSYQLWKDVNKGSKKALKEMKEYNKEDVVVLEDIYVYLKPYMKSHPHLGVLSGNSKCSCGTCGSTNIEQRGYSATMAGNMRKKFVCKSCGKWSTVSIATKIPQLT